MGNDYTNQFKKGAEIMVLLSIISNNETYGYDILKKLHNSPFGAFAGIQKGSVYPTLYKLEEDGYIKSRTVKIKGREVNLYSLTNNGAKLLAEMKLSWNNFISDVNSFIS